MTKAIWLGLALSLAGFPHEVAAAGIPSEDVFVQVRWSGWEVGLDAAGNLGFIGRETEAAGPMKRAAIDPEKALAFLSRLVELGFFTMDDRYRSLKGKLQRRRAGEVEFYSQEVVDGGEERILMVVGAQRKTVVLHYPAQNLPCGLEDWLADFKKLVGEELLAGD